MTVRQPICLLKIFRHRRQRAPLSVRAPRFLRRHPTLSMTTDLEFHFARAVDMNAPCRRTHLPGGGAS
jgi:hypothetical protein